MKRAFSVIAAAIIILTGCDSVNENMTGMPGKLVVKVTDDPFDISFVESATVTITKIEIRKAGDGESDGNPFMVISEDTITVDLIDLRNGITEEILNLEIPEGTYDLIRLYVDEAGLMIKNHHDRYSVKVPSGKQTGIKIFISPAITVTGGLTSELLLDFDLSRSFVMRGNMRNPHGFNGFIFKPVIRAVNNTKAGRVAGMVTDTLKAKIVNAKVWLEKDSVIATAYSDTTGKYAIIGIPSGTYNLFAVKENYDTASYKDVKISSGNLTVKNIILIKKK